MPGPFSATVVAGAAAVGLLAVSALGASDLAELARLDGAPGDEWRVIDFIRERVGGAQRLGANGSLIVEFGTGGPRTLLIAGVDEPGYAVSGLHEEGYGYLRPLANSPASSRLQKHFLGQHVRISLSGGALLQGVVPVPSVHFASMSRYRNSADTRDLFVDVGASSAAEARGAGLAVLDRVTLEKRPALLAGDWLAAPWIASRAGAATLLALARRLQAESFDNAVTLAFVTQQHANNASLDRVLRSVQAERVVALAPDGGAVAVVAAPTASDSGLADELARLASEIGLDLEPRRSYAFSFGPFGGGELWAARDERAVLLPAVRNGGTPAEAVNLGELAAVTELLARFVGMAPGGRDAPLPPTKSSLPAKPEGKPRIPSGSSLERRVRILLEAIGVSGREEAVRDLVLASLPRKPAVRTRTDGKGNLIVRLGADVPPRAIFIAHLDEIGYVVQRISRDGTVFATDRGGNGTLFADRPAAVHGLGGTLPALMKRPGVLDFGAASSEWIREQGVRVGDSVTVPKRFRKLLGHRVSGRSLDDRLGCAVLLTAIGRLAGSAARSRRSVEFAFSVEEETGLHGARSLAAEAVRARVYPVDTFVTSDSPLEPRSLAYARLGSGPVLRALDESGMTPRAEVARILALAQRHRIPLQVGITAGGNDGSVFQALETANVPIGFPLRYAHSAVETADLRDAEAAVDLIEVLALDELRGRP